MQYILVIVDIGNHPVSRSNEEIGAFLLTTSHQITLDLCNHCICLEAPDETTVFNNREY